MNEYEIRERALRLAIENSYQGCTYARVIMAAHVFASFIRGDEVQAIIRHCEKELDA